MLLHDSCRAARLDKDGKLFMLFEQDRKLWDRHKIQKGMDALLVASRHNAAGAYQLQAANYLMLIRYELISLTMPR